MLIVDANNALAPCTQLYNTILHDAMGNWYWQAIRSSA